MQGGFPAKADENCARQGCSGYSGAEFSNSALYSFFRRMVVGRDDAKGDDYYSRRSRSKGEGSWAYRGGLGFPAEGRIVALRVRRLNVATPGLKPISIVPYVPRRLKAPLP